MRENSEVMPNSILILNEYASYPDNGHGGRTRHLARELADIGFEVTVASARWSHVLKDFEKSKHARKTENFEGFKILRLKSLFYSNPRSPIRILNWIIFMIHICLLSLRRDVKPNIIIYSSPSPVAFLGAFVLAKIRSAKLVFEVRDIWPLTLVELGGITERNLLVRCLGWIEKFAYRHSDLVISNLEGLPAHIDDIGGTYSKFLWVPNGYMTSASTHSESSAGSDAYPSINFDQKKFNVIYAGTVGTANSLETLVDAAVHLIDHTDIKIYVAGSGALLDKLKKKAANDAANIEFLGWIPRDKIDSVIAKCDVGVICWNDAAIYRYGIAANKIFAYMAGKKPIVECYSGKFSPISKYGCGITVPACDSKSLSEAIVSFSKMPSAEIHSLGQRSYENFIQHHQYDKIASNLKSAFLDL